jgi:hypothetical protein
MGFDMYTVNEDGQDIHGCEDPSHGEHYWRRSIGSGGPQAQRLVDAGMGYWSGPPPGTKWPESEDAEFGEYDDETGETPALNDAAREHRAALISYLKATWDERPGIAVYKLCGTNDGWWVTKAECESALKLWEQAGQPDVDEYGDTIPFLRAGADHAGFRVW